MNQHWTDNELDNALFNEVSSGQPDPQTIRRLAVEGANVNAINTTADSVLHCAIQYLSDEQDLAHIRLLMELGADINYDEGGRWYNSLYYAGLAQLLLEARANPNCISEEDHESLLDWAEFDQFFEETDHPESNGGERMAQIVDLLKQYGAKPARELYADKPEIYLTVFATYQTGLFTAKGNLRIQQIDGADNDLICRFEQWQHANPDPWKNRQETPLPVPPDAEEYFAEGLALAQEIKQLVGDAIRVDFIALDADRVANGRRSVKEQTVDAAIVS